MTNHVWLVTTSGATWGQVGQFIRATLPTLGRFNVNPSTLFAVMLDGGGSTQFAYRRRDARGSVYQVEYAASNRVIHNIIGASAPWRQ